MQGVQRPTGKYRGLNATVLTIYNRWHGQDNTVAVVYDGVHWLVFNYMKIMLQVVVRLLLLGSKKTCNHSFQKVKIVKSIFQHITAN